VLDRPVFAFAGIWERWRSPKGVEVETCAILNTPANRLMGLFHERMPAILISGGLPPQRSLAGWAKGLNAPESHNPSYSRHKGGGTAAL